MDTNKEPNNAPQQNGNQDSQNILISIIAVIIILIIIGFGIHHYSVNNSNLSVATSTTEEATTTEAMQATSTAAVAPSAGPDINQSDIYNATYSVWGNSENVTLENGEFKSTNPNDLIYSTVEYFALGDVNGDGHRDGIVAITSVKADSEDEVFLVTKQNGQVVTTPLAVPVGQGNTMRSVHDITINSPVITMSLDVLGPNDAHCCASIHGTYSYTLVNNALVPVK